MNKLQFSKLNFTLNTSFQMLLRVFFTILIACFIFIGLYYTDNAYTHSTLQPSSGLLSLSHEELNTDTLFFLIRDWEYYPTLLLSPEDFKESTPKT